MFRLTFTSLNPSVERERQWIKIFYPADGVLGNYCLVVVSIIILLRTNIEIIEITFKISQITFITLSTNET